MGDHFGVGVGRKSGRRLLVKLVAQRREVLDDSVVDNRDTLCVVEVRVGVAIRGGTMGGPTECGPCLRMLRLGAAHLAASRGWPICPPCGAKPTHVADHSNASAVVAAVLKPAQALDDNVDSRLLPDVSHDPAHGYHPTYNAGKL